MKLGVVGTKGAAARVDSSPDNAGTGQHRQTVRRRQASRDGVREKPVAESSSSEATSSNLADRGWVVVRTRPEGEAGNSGPWMSSARGHEERLRRTRGDAAGA